jgi:hypothetical protein
MSSKSRKPKGNGGKPMSPQDKLQAAPQQQQAAPQGQRPERQFLIGEAVLTELVQYIQAVPSGSMPGGAAIKLFMTCQQLPELAPDGQGSFALKRSPQLAAAAPQPQETDG